MTDKKKDRTNLARRELFRAAGMGVGALGAAAVGMTAAAPEAKADDAKAGAGYRETDHVRTFYELSRF